MDAIGTLTLTQFDTYDAARADARARKDSTVIVGRGLDEEGREVCRWAEAWVYRGEGRPVYSFGSSVKLPSEGGP